jgi:hypothetical protein
MQPESFDALQEVRGRSTCVQPGKGASTIVNTKVSELPAAVNVPLVTECSNHNLCQSRVQSVDLETGKITKPFPHVVTAQFPNCYLFVNTWKRSRLSTVYLRYRANADADALTQKMLQRIIRRGRVFLCKRQGLWSICAAGL